MGKIFECHVTQVQTFKLHSLHAMCLPPPLTAHAPHLHPTSMGLNDTSKCVAWAYCIYIFNVLVCFFFNLLYYFIDSWFF